MFLRIVCLIAQAYSLETDLIKEYYGKQSIDREKDQGIFFRGRHVPAGSGQSAQRAAGSREQPAQRTSFRQELRGQMEQGLRFQDKLASHWRRGHV